MMIQCREELRKEIGKITPIVGRCYIQKIYSSSTLICLSARFLGKGHFLYLGRGHGVEGFWVDDKRVPVELRRSDRFLEYLRKYLSSSEMLDIFQVLNDRCLQIVYRAYGHENSFIFFWKGRKLYFLNYFFDDNHKKFYLMKSWGNKEAIEKKIQLNELYQPLLEVGLGHDFGKRPKGSKISVSMILERERKALIQAHYSNRKHRSLKRKYDRICHDLQRVESAISLQKKLTSEDTFTKEIGSDLVFENFKIKFDKNFNHFQKIDFIFKKIKSQKMAQKILEERKIQTAREIKMFEKEKNSLTFNPSRHDRSKEKKVKMIAPYWVYPEKKKARAPEALNPHIKIFRFEGGEKFAIGNNDEGNDFLRSKWGKNNDLWFHLEGHAGPHLILKRDGEMENLRSALLEVIASSLRDYAGLDIREIPLVFTRLKNIKGVRGCRGKVTYKREKYVKIRYSKGWKEKTESL